MNCQEHCKDEINKILENNRKMKDIEMKCKDRLYTPEELKEYTELSKNVENLEYDRQMCMDGCEQRNRGGGGHQGSQRTYPKVQNKTKRRQPQQKRQQKRQQRRTIRRTDSRMRRRYRNETFVAM